MSTIANLIARGQKSQEARLGSPEFTWSGADYACVPSTARQGAPATFGGYDTIIEVTLLTRRELFTGTQPAEGDAVTFDSQSYRITDIRKPADGINYELDLSRNPT